MAYRDFKHLSKILRDKTFNIAKNPKYDRYQKRLTSMVYKFDDRKTCSGALKVKLCKPRIR